MSDTCDKPIFRRSGGVAVGPTGHCALPKNHTDTCKLPEEVAEQKPILPDRCPYDSWHSIDEVVMY